MSDTPTGTKPQVLLFDLGGVLVDWAGIGPLLELTRGHISPEQARRFWLESSAVRDFEMGLCSADRFAADVIAGLNLTCTSDDFIAAFTSWDRGPFPGAVELLAELSGKYTLACLSNNNTIHWQRLREYPGFLDRFNHLFVSFEIQKIKPDADIFAYVLDRLPAPASAVVFFDDNIECVVAARQHGMRAFETRGIAAVREVLRKECGFFGNTNS